MTFSGRLMRAAWILILLCAGCASGETPVPSAPLSVLPAVTATERPSETPTQSAMAPSTTTPTPSLHPSATPTPSPTHTPGPPLQVVSSYPFDGDQAVEGGRPLVIEFDRPIETDSVGAHLVISPAIPGRIEWPTSQRLVYVPDTAWAAGVSYSLTLSPDLASAEGTRMSQPFHLCFSSGGRGVPVPVLMYHHILELDDGASEGQRTWTVSPDAFAAQMAYLDDQGWRTISPAQLAAYLEGGEPLPAKPLIISMDDGYQETYATAFPILSQTQLRPLLFIEPQAVGYPCCLEWSQLEELVAAGFFIGSHSYDHSDLRKVDEAGLEYQIGDSQAILSERLGVEIDAFGYPYGSGSYDERVLAALEAHGYTTAFTLNPTFYQSLEEIYRIGRLRVSYDTTFEEFTELLPESPGESCQD